MADISDIFALAEMYSEATKCSLEAALTDINARIKAVKAERRDEIERALKQVPAELPVLPEPPYEVVLLPFSMKAFEGAMKWATPGQGYTVAELCSAAGVTFPPGSKAPSHKLAGAGWTRTDLRRTTQNCKCSVYVKPSAELRVAS